MPGSIQPLMQLAHGWHAATRVWRARVAATLATLVGVLAVLFARNGTAGARVGAALAMGGGVVLAVGWPWLARRRLKAPEDIIRVLAWRLDRVRADRALRALSLVSPDDAATGGISSELARLHVSRVIGQLPAQRIRERAGETAARLRQAALASGVCVLAISLMNAWSVLEGADVLLARRGVAPLTMRWLDDVEIVARPPDYVHEDTRHETSLRPLVLPFGTAVTFRGTMRHAGRRLLLSDGKVEVPFVDDGAGEVVARWPLAQSTDLRVLARFGAVVVHEPEALAIESTLDRAPVVQLEGAPRQVLLVEQSEDIPIQYEATDDHGLREVHLVLRSGTREERRVLARLDGEKRSDRGGQVLALRDSFLKKSHAPVEVTVEAKDNDPLTGPKWGSSAALALIPPEVGEPEARRLEALRSLRDALVDSLAWRLSNAPPAEPAARAAFLADERKKAEDDDALLERTVTSRFGGVRVSSRIRSILVAQQQKTRSAIQAEMRAPSGNAHAHAVKATETFVLVADAVVRGLGFKDAKDAARQLADSADELAVGSSQGQSEETRSRGSLRMDAATIVLAGGARVLTRLGSLGRDLGEIVEADLLRVKRAREGTDFVHAELAARDLAARLREPDPSFGARGAERAGGESGGAHGTLDDDGEPSDAVDQAFNEAAQDLERLAQDHAAEIGQMEQALSGATSEEEREQMLREARRHAAAIREASRGLPTAGMGSDSWTSKGAAARELAEQMSQSLEQGRPDDAVQSGRSAVGALEEAAKMLQRGRWLEDPSGEARRHVDETRRKLEAEQKWAEGQLGEIRKRAAERARSRLVQGGDEEEKLAERARELAQRGRDHAPLPPQAIESIEDAEQAAHQAARALERGDADQGLDRQREAQRHLEAASQALRGDDDEPSRQAPNEGEASRPTDGSVAIPNANEHKGPEEFRRRVVRGLGEPASGGMKDAVHRYAEGLLR